MKWLILILSCLSCAAQFPLSTGAGIEWTRRSGVSTNTDFLNGLAIQFVAEDLATNTAISGNWTDRVQSAIWKMASATLQPTNSATGIWMDASHYLTNNDATYAATFTNCTSQCYAFGFIVNIADNLTGTHAGLLYNDAQYGSDDGTVIGFCTRSSGTTARMNWQHDATFVNLTPDPFTGTNYLLDIVIEQRWTNSANDGVMVLWTNAILCQTSSIAGAATRWGLAGNRAPWPTALPIHWSRSAAYKMRLREQDVWTNSGVGLGISSNGLYSFHQYAIKHYGISP